MGWIQKAGEARQSTRGGDSVWIAAGEKYWHGATDTHTHLMVHVAVAEASDTAQAAAWEEFVTDKEYVGA